MSKYFSVPFDSRGNLMYAGDNDDAITVEWRNSEVFIDTFVFDGSFRSRKNNAIYVWKSKKTGALFTMFPLDLEDTLRMTTIRNGEVAGWWTYRKRGTNFGIRPATEEEVRNRFRNGPAGVAEAAASVA